MRRKSFISTLCGLTLGIFLAGTALAQTPGASTTTTSTTTSTSKVPVKKAPVKVEETSTISTTTTTPTPPAPAPVAAPKPPRAVYDQEMLQKMDDKLCVVGFDAYVGSESKNVCNASATPPDIAYTCVWDKDGPPAFPASPQGPCILDYTEHRGEVVITRDKWKDNPPLKYGAKAQCCFRAAK